MKPRNTAILLVVALALGAFVYFWGVKGSEQRREAEAKAKRIFPGIEAASVVEVSLRTSDGRDARLERRAGRWELTAPLQFPADQPSAGAMASSLAEIQSESTIDQPQPPAVYGLGDDARVVRFRVQGQTEEHGLRIGKKTPVGGNTYAATLGKDAVYVVPTWRVNAFEKGLDELRDRRVVHFDRGSVDRVEASWPGGKVVLTKGDDGWRLVEPLKDEGDQETLDGLLSDLSFLRADRFLDSPTKAEEEALAKPEFVATLHVPAAAAAPAAEAKGRTVTFTLGQTADGKERVARGSGKQLYLVAEGRLKDMPRTVNAYRFKDLAKFVSTDAKSFELIFHGKPGAKPTVVRGTRGEKGWTTAPLEMAPGTASRLVSELSRLRAKDIEADAMGREQLASLGLAPPTVAVRVYGEPESKEGKPKLLAGVDLGNLDPQLGITARRDDRPTVFRVDAALAEHVPLGLEAFHHHFEKKAQAAGAGSEPAKSEAEEFKDFVRQQQGKPEPPAPKAPPPPKP